MIFVIDNYDSFTFNLVQEFGQLGAEIDVVRNDKFDLDDVEARRPTHLVISPGPGRPENAGRSIEAIERFHGRIPILGVCLGHQAIATAAGGRVVQAERLMHGKPSHVHHDGAPLFAGLPDPFVAARYHSLLVEADSLPSEITVQARTEEGEIMALRWGDASTWGVQFHPESILTSEGRRLLQNFLEETP